MAIAVHLAEQVDVTGQFLRRVFHLIFQLLMLRRARPFGKSSPYYLKVNDWVLGSDHCKGVGNGGDGGVAVEAFEVLPRRLVPIDDGVRTRRPTVGQRSHFQVDAVEHRLDSGNYGIELVPLDPGLLL